MNKNNGIPKIAVVVFTLFVSGLTFIVGLGIGRATDLIGNNNNSSKSNDINYKITGDKNSPKEIEVDFDRFWEVWEKLDQDYVDSSLNKQKMVDGAIKGMVDSIGDHVTVYYTAEETSAYEQMSAGNFYGIGAELGYENEQVVVKNPLNGSPAKQAGLLPGDAIIQVDNQDVTKLTISEIVLKIRGEKGTQVKIGIMRNGLEKLTEFTITRDEIHVDSVQIDKFEDGILVLQMNRFTESDYDKFTSQWDKIVNEIKTKNPRGMIIDLRGNPGGYLNGAVYTAADFVKKGSTILYVEDRDKNKQAYKASRDPRLSGIPVVILVNENTASAAEIFTGALRYHNKVTVIGERTVGKGTAQEVYKPAEWGGASLHLTVQHWLLPDMTWLNPENPIKPDIEIQKTEEDFKNDKDPQLDKAYEEIRKIMK